jgi:hypothetical protein
MTEIEQLRADNARLLELLANCHDSMRESGKQMMLTCVRFADDLIEAVNVLKEQQ